MKELAKSGDFFDEASFIPPPKAAEIIEPHTGLPLDVYLEKGREQALMRIINLGLSGAKDGKKRGMVKNRIRRIQDRH